MARKILPVNYWMLRTTPEVVQELEREATNIVLLGDSQKLNLNRVRLLTPPGTKVYHVISSYRGSTELVYATIGRTDSDPAYLSSVQKQTPRGELSSEGKSLNFARNIGTLLDYPWFSWDVSSLVFERFMNSARHAYSYAHTPEKGQHPLKIQK